MRRAPRTRLRRWATTDWAPLLHQLCLAPFSEVCITSSAATCLLGGTADEKRFSLLAYQSGLAGDAKPQPILVYPGIRESSMPGECLSIFDAFFFEDAGDDGGVAVKIHANVLVDDLV